jgi:hypothetical protein
MASRLFWSLGAVHVLRLGLVVGCGPLLGCGPSAGMLTTAGYEQPTFAYHVDYANKETQSFAGPDWRLDNFTWDALHKAWMPKGGDSYVAVSGIDENNDGNVSRAERRKELVYDLRLTNVHDNGILWIKAHRISPQDAQRDLDIQVSNYVDSLATCGAYEQTSLFLHNDPPVRQYATFVAERGRARAAGVSGELAVIELADSAGLQSNAAYRSAKIRAFFANIVYESVVLPHKDDKVVGRAWPLVACGKDGKSTCERAVGLLVVGYANDTEHFSAHLADFEGLLSRISLSPNAPAQPLSAQAAR